MSGRGAGRSLLGAANELARAKRLIQVPCTCWLSWHSPCRKNSLGLCMGQISSHRNSPEINSVPPR
ncbi:unnamed protein product [Chondrus crispus]|uniref:Uncharacterized protein n=1 Tax=Chondrus crispus TaxID=2769 RepID=R7QRV0_CHOCR|nr:unnamed protein product [Chondrus crispus]CDF40231.1 unnamed protein product [Chondrus crispus]|eukprot:XP_005710525.1 unnamed protein product [Chondrus crispus]